MLDSYDNGRPFGAFLFCQVSITIRLTIDNWYRRTICRSIAFRVPDRVLARSTLGVLKMGKELLDDTARKSVTDFRVAVE